MKSRIGFAVILPGDQKHEENSRVGIILMVEPVAEFRVNLESVRQRHCTGSQTNSKRESASMHTLWLIWFSFLIVVYS